MKTIKHSSSKRQNYEQKCIEMGKQVKVPIVDVPTRWNSTYAMLFRFLQMKEVSFIICLQFIMNINILYLV